MDPDNPLLAYLRRNGGFVNTRVQPAPTKRDPFRGMGERAKALGLLAASMLPGVGEAMDATDVVQGVRGGDPARAGFGLLGLMLPAVGGRVLSKAGELGSDAGRVGPRKVSFLRNTERAPNMGSTYQQDIEPAGRYMIEKDPGVDPLPGWEAGEVTFENPLVVPWSPTGSYDDESWKAVLSKRYGGKTGEDLSRAIVEDGYDGIITTRGGETSEIVDLTGFRPSAPDPGGLLGAVAAPDLPMDEASRMARAREMGFDVDAYHGTGSDFDSFRPWSHFAGDPEQARMVLEYKAAYSMGDRLGHNVMPTKLRGNFAEMTDGVGWGPREVAQQAVERGYLDADEVKAALSGASNVDELRTRVAALMRDAGYDGVKYGNKIEGGGRDAFMVFDPKNIRSRFARFDPSKSESADLLAGLTGAALVRELLTPDEIEQYGEDSGYAQGIASVRKQLGGM